jgi:hypothetical protein
MAVIESTIMKYQGPTQHCQSNYSSYAAKKNAACDMLILGSLLKSAAMNGLWPPPTHPYTGLTFSDIFSRVRSLEITALCDEQIHSVIGAKPPLAHGLKQSISLQINAVDANMTGLDLNKFKEPKEAVVVDVR